MTIRSSGEIRDAAAEFGVHTLATSELIRAIVPGVDAGTLLADFLTLDGLRSATLEQLTQYPGIGTAAATALLCALQLGARTDENLGPALCRPEAMASYLHRRFFNTTQEVMGYTMFDSRNHALKSEIVFQGTANRCVVDPATLLRRILTTPKASRCAIWHTHPSGNPHPSAEDISFTRRCAAAFQTVGVELLDHLIVAGRHSFCSLRQEGAFS